MKVLQILVLIFGLSIFANAQTKDETLFVLKGKIIYQRIQTNEAAKIFFQDKDKIYQSKIKEDNAFEIKLPKGIYQAKIIIESPSGTDEYLFEKIRVKDIDLITFDLEKADSVIVSCNLVTMLEIIIIPDNIKPSYEIKLRPLQKLPEAQNKNNKEKKQ